MTPRRAVALLVACLVATGSSAAALAAGPSAPGGGRAPVGVSLDRANLSVPLGESFRLGSTISNAGRRPLRGLVAHLNVVSLTDGVYVDPEDWSPQRTRYLPTLRPGQSARVGWSVDAVSGGRFAVYVVVIPRGAPKTASAGLAIGRPLTLRVAERRVFDSGGVLILTLGVPALIGLAMVGVRAVRRRPRRPTPPAQPASGVVASR